MIRDLVSMGKPHHTQLEASSHASQGARSPEHHSLLLSFHQPHSHLVPERITGSCMTMTKFLKQTSVQAFLPFLLVPLVVTTETQGHEVSKAKNIKTGTF